MSGKEKILDFAYCLRGIIKDRNITINGWTFDNFISAIEYEFDNDKSDYDNAAVNELFDVYKKRD